MRYLSTLAMVLSVSLAARAQTPTTPTEPRPSDSLLTAAEASGFARTSRYDEVMAIVRAIDEQHPHATLQTIGSSTEGRDIPMLVLADREIKDAKAARALERPIVLLMANIHAGEVEGKEALLMLARDLAARDKADELRKVVLLVMPIYNTDGNERIDPKNRSHQTGPAEGVGVRENAQGLDLNRDYVRMAAPETRALVRVMNEWDPAVVVDCHTTNGSFHRYTLTYSSPRHPSGDPAIRAFAASEMLPAVSASLEAATGYKTFWYGDFNADHTAWESYPAIPRYGETYVALRNRIAILSEAYVYASFEDRVRCTKAFCEEIVRFVGENAAKVTKLVRDADEATTKAGESGADVALRVEARPLPNEVTVLGWEEQTRDGRQVRTDTPRDYAVKRVDDWVPTLSTKRAYAYLFAPEHTTLVHALQRHGIRVAETREDIELDSEMMAVDRAERSERAFQGVNLLSIDTATRSESRVIPAGWWIVRTTQPLGTLAAYLLEPMSQDGLATWDLIGGVAVGADFPVLRLQSPVAILSTDAPDLPEDAKSNLPITFEAVYESKTAPNLSGSPVSGLSWRDDGEHFLQRKDGKTWRVHARTGRLELHSEDSTAASALEKIPVIDRRAADRLASSGSRRFTEDRSAFFVEHENDLYYATMDGTVAVRLTSTPEREELATFSPDGRFVAFVKNQNIWVVDVETRTERQLTTSGHGLVECGKAGWVYFEELFNRDWQAYWWSPDSRRIAFLETDSTNVPEFVIVDDNTEPQTIERTRYPRVGEPNPDVRVGIVSIAGGEPRWVDLSAYEHGRFIIPGVSWFKDGGGGGDLFLTVQDRFQTWMDVCRVGVNGGRPEVLWRESTEAWVEWLGSPRFLKDGSYLWLSERTGWKHVYLIEKGSKEPKPVTSGPWEVRSIAHVDEEGKWLWFTATADSHIAENLYRIRFDGTEMQKLTSEPGHHSVSVSPKGDLFIDSWSALDRTSRVTLRDASGTAVRTLDTNPVRDLAKYRRGRYELVQIPVEIEGREPYVLEGSILYPPDFDPEKSYPVWFQTYGGPHAPTVRDAWGPMLWEHVLAHEGFILFRADPYSSSGKGARSAWTCYKQLGIDAKDDVLRAIEWIKQRPYIDPERIGMHGHSFGGYLTSFVMTQSSVLAAGIAGAPVTDWSLYDTIYMERYMLTPQANPDGYKRTSVIEAAKNLSGLLLVTHGTMDDNVHFQNAIRLIDAFQKAKKQFRVMILPGYRHGLFGDHYRRMMYEFILEMRDRRPADRPESAGSSGESEAD